MRRRDKAASTGWILHGEGWSAGLSLDRTKLEVHIFNGAGVLQAIIMWDLGHGDWEASWSFRNPSLGRGETGTLRDALHRAKSGLTERETRGLEEALSDPASLLLAHEVMSS